MVPEHVIHVEGLCLRPFFEEPIRGTDRGTVRGIDILAVGRYALIAGICIDVLHQHILPLHSVGENMI